MSIQFQGGVFKLETRSTSYHIKITDQAYLMHLYYGAKIGDADVSCLFPRAERSFSPNPAGYPGRDFSLDTLPQEYSGSGAGDFRLSSLAAGHGAVDLHYVRHRIVGGKPALAGLPSCCAAPGGVETLELELEDPVSGLCVRLLYGVYEADDFFTRSAVIVNRGAAPLTLHRAMSFCLDLPAEPWQLLGLPGAWARERQPERQPLRHGVQGFGSKRGASSHQHNPFFTLCAPHTTEHSGPAYGFGLVYSGSYACLVEQDQFDTVRCVMGIQPEGFSWSLGPGEAFYTPEAVLAFSRQGLNGMSQIFHRAVRTHLCRGPWAHRRRPILMNNWEATYFDFDEQKLLALARRAAELGVELLVVDDGWFVGRSSDTSSLGDWSEDPAKLPRGLAGLAEALAETGLALGLWIEPEMVSPASELYRRHPDWCLHQPGRPATTGRDQLVLDLSRKDVRDHVWQQIDSLLQKAPISYLKWDMNRHLTEVGSALLPPERQGEAAHRYMLGVYELMERLFKHYPQVLVENCSGGGGRFDLGMLHYSPQIWASDDTDALERAKIQYGTSYCYPLSCMGCHVSAVPNHQTGRVTSLKARGDTALWGQLGYEMDLALLTEEEKAQVRRQCEFYKRFAPVLHAGAFYRLPLPGAPGQLAWGVLSADQRQIFVFHMAPAAQANAPVRLLKLPFAAPGLRYRETSSGCCFQGTTLRYAGIALPPHPGDCVTTLLHFQAQ